jgi:Common central domain of tyrosinase/Polyphenol oxidase middle domain/Protein of unknown function (DUF_B2219)
MRALPTLLVGALVLGVHIGHAGAQSPQFVPAYPLYCQGPLTRGAPSGGKTTTPYVWATTGAGAASPAPGQCAWADRAARGVEIQSGGGNVICDFSGAMQSVPAGMFVEVGVARDPLVSNCMHLARYIGTVSPPFSAAPSLAPFVRQSVATLTPAQIASLRHGIAVMMSRSISDPTSYAFQANIHGTPSSPSTPQEMASWNNCEHGSYHFFSWHRMYIYFFDRILRAAAGDPELVLPYWNWTDPAQRTLPAPFRQPADSSNPLYIPPTTSSTPGRPAAFDSGSASLGAGTVDYSVAFADTNFDSPTGSGASFGGQIAAPMQFNGPHGAFESQPHDVVHVAVGGLNGLMTDPDTAAKDPIFWLHHANIDRMWNRWLAQGGGRGDPSDAAWRNQQFTFYDEAGHAVYLTGAEVEDTVGQLNYRYDDDPLTLRVRFPRFGLVTELEPHAPPAVPTAIKVTPVPLRVLAQTAPAAGAPAVELAGKTERLEVPLTETASARLRVLATNKASSETIVLRLDNIRYEKSSGVYYEVYVNPPPGEALNIHAPGYVGNLALFGLKPHAMPGHTAPAGDIHVDFDVSPALSEVGVANQKGVSVVLVPRGLFDDKGEPLPVAESTQGSVGSVRILSR